jgi:hypothetical protein
LALGAAPWREGLSIGLSMTAYSEGGMTFGLGLRGLGGPLRVVDSSGNGGLSELGLCGASGREEGGGPSLRSFCPRKGGVGTGPAGLWGGGGGLLGCVTVGTGDSAVGAGTGGDELPGTFPLTGTESVGGGGGGGGRPVTMLWLG